MKLRFTLVVALALFGAQATVTASTSYGFGTIFGGNAPDGVAVAYNPTAYETDSTAPFWTENYISTGPANQQIVCVVAIATQTTTTNSCGGTGSGSGAATDIPVTPPGAGTLPGGVSEYLLMDGDPDYGAPVSVDMTGLTATDTYTVSFYQAASEELQTNGTALPGAVAYDDSWEVYVGTTTTGAYICPQAYCNNHSTLTNAPGTDTLKLTTPSMDDAAGGSTAWEFESFTFVATATSQILEFVTNVESSTGTALAADTTFEPPILALADVTVTQQGGVPEPGTWALTLLGVGTAFAAGKLRRKFSARR
jgi:hypothetical protein